MNDKKDKRIAELETLIGQKDEKISELENDVDIFIMEDANLYTWLNMVISLIHEHDMMTSLEEFFKDNEYDFDDVVEFIKEREEMYAEYSDEVPANTTIQ